MAIVTVVAPRKKEEALGSSHWSLETRMAGKDAGAGTVAIGTAFRSSTKTQCSNPETPRLFEFQVVYVLCNAPCVYPKRFYRVGVGRVTVPTVRETAASCQSVSF